MTDHLFISHASEDEAVVGRIVEYLEGRGVACWIAGRDIPPRAIYAEAITEGIRQCSACAVIVSKAANASAAIKRELELASHYGKAFIPIRVDSTEPGPGLDYYLRNTQWINYGRDGNRALDRIADHQAGRPVQATPAYSPAPQPPSSSPSNLVRPALFAVTAIAVVAVGWFVWSSSNSSPTQIAEAPVGSEESLDAAPPSQVDPATGERERLQRERDEALEAARRAENALASERERQPPPQVAADSGILGTWDLTDSGCSSPWRFAEIDGRLRMYHGDDFTDITEQKTLEWGRDRTELYITDGAGRSVIRATGDAAFFSYVGGSNPCNFRRRRSR